MLFNSLDFLVFVLLFFALWPLMRRVPTIRFAYITLASFVFYGWWDPRFVLLLVGTGLIDFFAALAIEAWPRFRRLLLFVSMSANLGALATFKYLNFAIDSANSLASVLGTSTQFPVLNLILPVGISFYTFESMSYTIDVYRGELKATRNVLHFFAFLSLFSRLVAGPIVRAANFLPQLLKCEPPSEAQRWDGLRLIVHGYFKKMVIADALSQCVGKAFGTPDPSWSGLTWWLIVLAFSFQIYCDFSGYSDIARGLAKWMGYEFPVNFNHPYTATSLRDFWGRWHISLSSWFRDYVYIPLGGSRSGPLRSHVNLWITMLLSGLWHGASWTYVIWGGIHALGLTLERLVRWPERVGRVASLAITMVFVMVGWVFFRATSFEQACGILGLMFNPAHWSLSKIRGPIDPNTLWILMLAIGREAWVFLGVDRTKLMTSPGYVRWQPAVVALLIVACVHLRGSGDAFIYFQF